MAFLLWPQSEVWPRDGEIDFPEGNLTATIDAYLHFQGAARGTDQVHFPTDATYGDWHTAVIEWTPDGVSFVLDGELVGRATQRIPATPMRWTLQVERCLDGCAAPGDAEGHVQIDWVTQYSYEPDTMPDPPTPPAAPATTPEQATPTIAPPSPTPKPDDGMPVPNLVTLAHASTAAPAIGAALQYHRLQYAD